MGGQARPQRSDHRAEHSPAPSLTPWTRQARFPESTLNAIQSFIEGQFAKHVTVV